jgi:hypothetical protein
MNSFQAGLTNIRNRLELALQKYGGSFDFVSFNTEILSGRSRRICLDLLNESHRPEVCACCLLRLEREVVLRVNVIAEMRPVDLCLRLRRHLGRALIS